MIQLQSTLRRQGGAQGTRVQASAAGPESGAQAAGVFYCMPPQQVFYYMGTEVSYGVPACAVHTWPRLRGPVRMRRRLIGYSCASVSAGRTNAGLNGRCYDGLNREACKAIIEPTAE